VPQVSAQVFERLPLRVHASLAGVPLHDVWSIDLPRWRSGLTLDEFLRATGNHLFTPSPVVPGLLAIRFFAGTVFSWDPESVAPAPEAFATRLTPVDRSRSLTPAGSRGSTGKWA
jgi:hypothetical protein